MLEWCQPGAPPSDFELMSAMMQRVALLEKTVKRQAEEIEQKVNTHLRVSSKEPTDIYQTLTLFVFIPLKGKIILKLKKKLRTPEEPGTYETYNWVWCSLPGSSDF